ncbi:glycosyl hydrolase [Paenibacillus swuensis]|uniref:Glycosyl hydrolase n=1 Tax=Paenibacillus swuensis TaxID=1178515 RepID=A0A172TDP2_9BACL|nr:glycosyl hydrolase family 18 protein [Paenibacillus swuensis]ANE45121.1 glycosyl hydrolase [Paenibacillus swuensis]
MYLFIWICIVTSICLSVYYLLFAPNTERVEPDFHGLDKPVFYRGLQLEEAAVGTGEGLMLTLETLQKHIDGSIYYEETTESVILTTKDKVVRLRTERLTGLLNAKPLQLHFPVKKIQGRLYVPVAPIKQLYGLVITENPSTGAVLLKKTGDVIRSATAESQDDLKGNSFPLRVEPDRRAPIVADLIKGQQVTVWDSTDDWLKVQLQNGVVGYIKTNHVLQGKEETVKAPTAEKMPYTPWKPAAGKVNLTWEHVVRATPDPAGFAPMPGVNVISPTWFELLDGQGNIASKADMPYVKWAHAKGLQVWALFSNGFEPDRTSAALATYDRRLSMIKQILSYAETYDLQGINLDFEHVYLKDKALLTQFVRELTPLLHEQGLVVSMDVTPKSTSEVWSLFYDRKALAQTVDYMMIMAYDEHWASSPEAGSVASLPWTEVSLRRILEEDEVPADKVVLAIPFYTRLWTEETVNGTLDVSSKALSMEKINGIILEKKLKPVFLPDIGQHYVEYTEGGKRYRAWLEDATSVKARMELVRKYKLAGTASWRRGFETPEIWAGLQQELFRKP